jgi:ribosomal protein L11 methyltransferase
VLTRLRAVAPDSTAARAMAERLAEPDEDGTEALATSSFEDPTTGGWHVDAYYPSAPDLTAVFARIGLWLDAETPPSLESVPDENWVAISQAALPPVAAGRFLVHGGHDRDAVGRRRLAIEIDAGEAFGTAHHATTQGCLAAIDRLARISSPRTVLDLGCGSGLLAIASARHWPAARIVASDIDPVAVEVAAANVALNGARGRIRMVTAKGLDHPRLRDLQPYDLVVANILAGPLIGLAPRLSRAVRPGGFLVLSGLLGEQAREVFGTYAMAGFRLKEKRVPHNWATLVLNRI